jgi:hypothetical protein
MRIAHVLTQFGLVPGSAVDSDAEAGRRIADWLLAFDGSLDLCHDFKLDWPHVQQAVTAAERWPAIAPWVRACNVAAEVDQPAALDAQESYFASRSRPGRHHALVDAHALRERWRAAQRLAPAADPDVPVVRRAQAADACGLSGLAERTFRDAFEAVNTPEKMDWHCRDSYGEAIQAREISDP